MYKYKIIAWIVAIALLFGFEALVPVIKKSFSKKEVVEIKFEGEEINDLSQSFSNMKINGYKLRIDETSPHILFTQNKQKSKDYYEYENALYSPLCLYVDSCVVNNDESFISVEGNSYWPYKVDLKSILQAMEKDKKWSDLGFNEAVFTGNVTLYIAESGLIYDKTEELFYLTLNDGKTVDEAKEKELKSRVDAIIKKCKKVRNIQQLMEEKYATPGKDRIAILAPEYYYYSLGSCTNTGNSHSFVPIYFNKTVYFDTYIYVVNSAKENQSVNTFLEKIKTKNDFLYYSGWRARSITYDVNNLSSAFLTSP